jgi:hypothetical protein
VADELLDQAQGLIGAGKAEQAYQLLKPEADARAGDADFDFLYATAALDAGHALDAVFALERVIDANPNNGPARAKLALAYVALGETESAEQEFGKVKDMPLPEDVSATIDKYLSEIERHHALTRPVYRRYVKTGLGFDSNVNSATDDNQVAVPGLGGLVFTLAPESRELDSMIWDVGAGFDFSHPLQAGLNVTGGIDFDHRIAPEESDFTTTSASGHLGLDWLRGKNRFSLIGQGEKMFVDGSAGVVDADREVGGLTLQWQHNLNPANQFTVFGQAALVRYPDQRVRNVNRYTGGIGWAHAYLNAASRPVVYASFYGGTEDEQNHTFGEHNSRDFYGVRVGGQVAAGAKGTVLGQFSYQNSDYDAPVPLFNVTRDDDFIMATVGYRYQYDVNWSLTPTLRYSNSDSNFVLTDYDRVEVMFTIRNDF